MTPWPARLIRWTPLAALLVAYAALATGYRHATPFGEGPDEPGHIAYVSFLRANGRPPRHGEVGEPLKQQVKHPPLYYALGALATIGHDDRGLLFFPNPQFSPADVRSGVVTAHRHTQDELPPPAPRYAFVAALRRLSMLLGLVTVWATVQLARTVLPGREALALASGAVVAFLPQFLFMSGVANNDALATAAGTLALLAAARVAVAARPPRGRDLVALGLLLGVGLLAKLTTLAMLPVAALAVLIAARRARAWRVLALGAAWCGGTLAGIAGGLMVWNTALGGDVLGWTGFETAAAASLRRTPLLPELPAYFGLQFRSFLGRFGWMAVPLPPGLYAGFGVLLAAAAVGLVVVVGRQRRRASRSAVAGGGPDGVLDDAGARWGVALLLAACALVYASVFRLAFAFDLVVAQGRYLFTALGAFGVLFVLGLTGWLPARWRTGAQGALAVGWFGLGAYGLTGVLRPAFGPVLGIAEASTSLNAHATFASVTHGADFGPGWVRLSADPCVAVERLPSGGVTTLPLRWVTSGVQPPAGLVLFAELVDGDGRVLSHVDRLPLGGRYPSSAWLPDRPFTEVVELAVPPVDAPRLATVVVGWTVDGRPEARVAAVEGPSNFAADARPCGPFARHRAVPPTGDGYAWPVVLLPAEPITLPPNVHARADTFGEPPRSRLVAVSVHPSAASEGDAKHDVTLYWTALRTSGETSYRSSTAPAGDDLDGPEAPDDTVFVHLTAPDGRLVLTADGPPAHGRFPPSLWRRGDVVADVHELSLAGVPAGRYRLSVGWYDPATGTRRPARDADGASWADGEAMLGTVVVGSGTVRFEPIGDKLSNVRR